MHLGRNDSVPGGESTSGGLREGSVGSLPPWGEVNLAAKRRGLPLRRNTIFCNYEDKHRLHIIYTLHVTAVLSRTPHALRMYTCTDTQYYSQLRPQLPFEELK